MLAFSTAPQPEAPADWPTKRRNIEEEVAAPRWRQGTDAWMATMNTVLTKPMPMPMTKAPAAAQTGPSAGLSTVSMAQPAESAMPPVTAPKR